MKLSTDADIFEPVIVDAMFLRSICTHVSPAAAMVAVGMIASLDREGVTRYNVSELANLCNCDKSLVSRAAKELIELKFCEPVRMATNSLRFRVSRHFAVIPNGGK